MEYYKTIFHLKNRKKFQTLAGFLKTNQNFAR